ncbi:hypothetical protein M2390_001539 [Mycetocola sp. BIGb0189]|uniref:hypothetical protein n=1 Tax=Mycetocola sp. BIGb0189 TaxID=2940604 RepID=UPI002168B8A6|nr:hypothetical protein [Mycetocola sp. BIGb0189]MCS4276357.1 hypothetical protein [Mycetocola sp. BIGb0189]
MTEKIGATDGTAEAIEITKTPEAAELAETASATEAAVHVAFADAALALAGHELSDPVLRALLERVARGELDASAAVAEMRRHVGA